ncbi:MAG: hypothetical protein UX07_C0033G0008 [Parcubacteria group bacterium GW2011_GWA2_45_30]|nr:MAG: hypothetical protein UX07_C0033G0008 [Parcubacteria group bacterium GW2011_GWA2_45_30]
MTLKIFDKSAIFQIPAQFAIFSAGCTPYIFISHEASPYFRFIPPPFGGDNKRGHQHHYIVTKQQSSNTDNIQRGYLRGLCEKSFYFELLP